MARISEQQYFNACARGLEVGGVLKTTLTYNENPANYVASFYQSDGTVGIEIPLSHPNVQISRTPDANEQDFIISASQFPILLTDPEGRGASNYVAYALSNSATGEVIDFYDIGGSRQAILAVDGAVAGATSQPPKAETQPSGFMTTNQVSQPAARHLPNTPFNTPETGIACFAAGTRIRTQVGHQLIDTLSEGDLIWTRDNGLRPLRWVGHRKAPGTGKYAPVQFSPNTFGALKPHQVSQNHRMLLTGWRARLLFGEDEILVPAKTLVDNCDVRICECEEVTYYHLLFDDHQIVNGDGVLSESFFPGAVALKAIGYDTQHEMFALFPELATGMRVPKQSPRPVAPTSLGPLLMRS